MISIWIFAIFIILFVGVIIWERWDYVSLKKEYRTIEFFLDLYVDKYGSLPGMIIVEEAKDADPKK